MNENSSQENQLILKLLWQNRFHQKLPLPSLDDAQFRAYSQNGEDGILLFIFSLVGTTNKKCVEICVGNGIECNTANLIVNHGWLGLLFDGDQENINEGKQFYANNGSTRAWPPNLQCSWITKDNINQLIEDQGVSGEIDLLSLDMDGNDYWILESLNIVNPRVIILEYENSWPADKSVTQRYEEDFHDSQIESQGLLPRYGASLAAFKKLAAVKGYRLIGCERLSFNAVFMRNDIGIDIFPTVEVTECLSHELPRYRLDFLEKNSEKLLDKWVEV
jgi:hypothetical protein